MVVVFISSLFLLIQFSRSVLSNSLRPHGLQHNRPPCPSPTPGAYSSSMPIESSNHLILCRPLLLLPSVFPSIRVFQMSHLFTSSGQSIGVSASTSVFPMNIQDSFPLGWTGLNSLLSKGLSRVFSNTTVQKHQFFGVQPSWHRCTMVHFNHLLKGRLDCFQLQTMREKASVNIHVQVFV